MSNIYSELRETFEGEPDVLHRCAEHILALRKALQPIRSQRSEDSMLLATWNIRDFDGNGYKYGPRKKESFYYIAEVISAFDLVAVQEINRSLKPLKKVMEILGGGWDYIVTDATEGLRGNDERMAFLFNKDRVFFRKIAGEVVLPFSKRIMDPSDAKRKLESEAAEPDDDGDDTEQVDNGQFARTPFLVAFQSGWFKFSLCTVHIFYGEDSGKKLRERIAEIRTIVDFFANRQAKEMAADKKAAMEKTGSFSATEAENYILLGDFNVLHPEHETAKALERRGFMIPDVIDGDKVRKKGAHYYDQIAVSVTDKRFEIEGGGIFDLYDHVYRDDQIETYRPDFEEVRKAGARDKKDDDDKDAKYYAKWRTFQMSDHSPLWVKIKTDFATDYLTNLIECSSDERLST